GIGGFFYDGENYYGYDNDEAVFWGYNETQVHSTTGLVSSYYHGGIVYWWGGSGTVTVAGTSENEYGDGYVTPITASAGDIYILMIDNFTGSSSPFNLTW